MIRHPRRRHRRAGGERPPSRRPARHSPQGEQHADVTERDEGAWYGRPWNDSRHPIRLLETLGIAAGGSALAPAFQSALTRPPAEHTTAEYDLVDRLLGDWAVLPGVDGVVHPAAGLIFQAWVARSDAGGQIANIHMRSAIGWLIWRGLNVELVRWEVGRARANDLGLSDADVAAFRQLWLRREYAAAWRLHVTR